MSPVNPQRDNDRAGLEPQPYWRNLAEWAGLSDSNERLRAEFPEALGADPSQLNRRHFHRLMAASLALAGATLSGCRRWPEQQIRPMSEREEGYLPGVARYYATLFELGGVATGILAKSVDGRPIKIEGNERHPFSLGAAGVFAQASVLELYDPDRTQGYLDRSAGDSSQAVRQPRRVFEEMIKSRFGGAGVGRGVRVLSQSTSSPTVQRLRREFLRKFPEARWHVYQPIDRDHEFEGTRLCFGKPVRPQYRLAKAQTIVCLGADLLGAHPGHQKWARDWAAGRDPNGSMYNRMWVFESQFSLTGAAADHRVPVRPSQIVAVARALAVQLGLVPSAPPLNESLQAVVERVGAELKASAGTPLLVAGPAQPPEVHAIVHTLNHHLGAAGKTIVYTDEPLAEECSSVESIAELAQALDRGEVETLLILHGNPVYDSPGDIDLDLSGGGRTTSIYLGLFDNETARASTWHAGAAHALESWTDGRAWDGTYSVGQPLIYPLLDGISETELLSLAIGQPVENGLELVRATARSVAGVLNDAAWNRLLHDGVAAGTEFAPVDVTPRSMGGMHGSERLPVATEGDSEGLEISFVSDASVYDGRFANNAWLQELPDPMTKLTWDNAALISKQDADRLGVTNGDLVSIELAQGNRLDSIPILIQPGQAVGALTLPLGYGRRTGAIGGSIGVDVRPIRFAADRYLARNGRLKKTGKTTQLACTQEHFLIDPVGQWGRERRLGRPNQPGRLVRETTLQQHRRDPQQVHGVVHVPSPAPMFNPPDQFNSPSAWGMSIDLNACIGCNGCVIACQAENNIPVVGKDNVLQSREMHWIRIDRYFKGDIDSPEAVHVPVACAQCEDAPCEQVCPVAATVHDTEGLNAMVYNRCIGTRYCGNNCPYKVRRFNYFDYHASNPKTPPTPWMGIPDRQQDSEIPLLKQMVYNPEVTVRMRGVMEKCTYCVQRISAARIQARNEHAQGLRDDPGLREGEVMTACQQACPTRAIRFGDLNDRQSAVSLAHADARAYSMLEETNIKPRTRYLVRIRNVDLEPDSPAPEAHGSGGSANAPKNEEGRHVDH